MSKNILKTLKQLSTVKEVKFKEYVNIHHTVRQIIAKI